MTEERRSQFKEMTFANILDKAADFIDVPLGFPKNHAELEKRDNLRGTRFMYQSKYGGKPLQLVAAYVSMSHSYGEKVEGSERASKGVIFQKVIDYLPGAVSITLHTAEKNYYDIKNVINIELPVWPG